MSSGNRCVGAQGEAGSEWPRNFDTRFAFQPPTNRRLAAVWRKTWKPGHLPIPAASAVGFSTRAMRLLASIPP